MREYTDRVDREGCIFHDGSEIVNPATLRFFLLALPRTPDGRWLALCQGERNWFEAADTPFVIQRLTLRVSDGRLEGADLGRAGDYREALEPATLVQDGGRLFCRVRRGSFTARFGRVALCGIGFWGGQCLSPGGYVTRPRPRGGDGGRRALMLASLPPGGRPVRRRRPGRCGALGPRPRTAR